MRGSIRKVMVTDSEASALPATAPSIRRTSGLFSAQKPASAASLSKIGTSSHLAIARIFVHYVRVVGCERPIGKGLAGESDDGDDLIGSNFHFTVRAGDSGPICVDRRSAPRAGRAARK